MGIFVFCVMLLFAVAFGLIANSYDERLAAIESAQPNYEMLKSRQDAQRQWMGTLDDRVEELATQQVKQYDRFEAHRTSLDAHERLPRRR